MQSFFVLFLRNPQHPPTPQKKNLSETVPPAEPEGFCHFF